MNNDNECANMLSSYNAPETIRYLDMPKSIANRVSDYFEYLLARNHPGSDGMLAVSQLPTSMFRDISSRMYEDHVKKVDWLELAKYRRAKEIVLLG